jgi:hypothetical protein
MSVLEATGRLERDFLRGVYELAGRRPKSAVSFVEVRGKLGHSEDQAERACEYWADRGIIEWTTLGHIALTYMGLRRAERLAERGWRPHIPF